MAAGASGNQQTVTFTFTGDATGWSNQNYIFGGRCSHNSNEGAQVAGTATIKLLVSDVANAATLAITSASHSVLPRAAVRHPASRVNCITNREENSLSTASSCCFEGLARM